MYKLTIEMLDDLQKKNDILVSALNIIADAHLMANITVEGLQKIAKQALKAAGETV